MNIDQEILQIAKLAGLTIYDEDEFLRIANYQLIHNQFKFIEHEGKAIGFFGWLMKDSEQGKCICINNMFIFKRHQDNFNIFSLCKFFKEKYGKVYKIEWHNQKKDRFRELIVK